MGGEGPYTKFCPEDRTFWASHTGLQALDPKELEAAYTRAHDFLLKRQKELVDKWNWSADKGSAESLFSVTGSMTVPYRKVPMSVNLTLPRSVSSFLDSSHIEKWKKIFENGILFDGKQDNRNSMDLYIDGIKPVSDIFYLLQALIPGMLLIIRVDEYDESEEQCSRALPRPAWLGNHKDTLEQILGSKERYEDLLHAAEDRSRSYETEWISTWSSYDEWDYTACGIECGYCGLCDYAN